MSHEGRQKSPTGKLSEGEEEMGLNVQKLGEMVRKERSKSSISSNKSTKAASTSGEGEEEIIHHLDLTNFKTRQCKSGANHIPKRCACFHDPKKDRRRFPHIYSAEMCSFISTEQECPMRDTCEKCHNRVEEFYHPTKYKTKFCSSYPHSVDKCEYGEFCCFAHSERDIKIDLIHKFGRDIDFYLFHFKTVWCPFNENNHPREQCVYAHNWQDFRRKPFIYSYEREQCGHWDHSKIINIYTEGCPGGLKCRCSHGWKEQEYHPSSYKMNQCRHAENCSKIHCPYFHSEKDRRYPPPQHFCVVPKTRVSSFQSQIIRHPTGVGMGMGVGTLPGFQGGSLSPRGVGNVFEVNALPMPMGSNFTMSKSPPGSFGGVQLYSQHPGSIGVGGLQGYHTSNSGLLPGGYNAPGSAPKEIVGFFPSGGSGSGRGAEASTRNMEHRMHGESFDMVYYSHDTEAQIANHNLMGGGISSGRRLSPNEISRMHSLGYGGGGQHHAPPHPHPHLQAHPNPHQHQQKGALPSQSQRPPLPPLSSSWAGAGGAEKFSPPGFPPFLSPHGTFGAQGIQGIQGSQGSQGSQGIQGIQGSQGNNQNHQVSNQNHNQLPPQGFAKMPFPEGGRKSQELPPGFTNRLSAVDVEKITAFKPTGGYIAPGMLRNSPPPQQPPIGPIGTQTIPGIVSPPYSSPQYNITHSAELGDLGAIPTLSAENLTRLSLQEVPSANLGSLGIFLRNNGIMGLGDRFSAYGIGEENILTLDGKNLEQLDIRGHEQALIIAGIEATKQIDGMTKIITNDVRSRGGSGPGAGGLGPGPSPSPGTGTHASNIST